MKFNRILASSRYITMVAVVGSLFGSAALLVYEAFVIIEMVVETITSYNLSPGTGSAICSVSAWRWRW